MERGGSVALLGEDSVRWEAPQGPEYTGDRGTKAAPTLISRATLTTVGSCDYLLMPETAEELSKKPEVRQELARTSGEKARDKVKAEAKDKFWFLTHALLLIGCAVIYYLVGTKLIPLLQAEVDLTRRFLRGTALIVMFLATAKAVKVYAIGRIDDAVTRFTLQRIQYLIVGVLIAIIAVSVIFVNWYAALTAL